MGRNGFGALVTNVAKGATPGVIRETVEDTEKQTEPDQQSALPPVPIAQVQPRPAYNRPRIKPSANLRGRLTATVLLPLSQRTEI